MSAPIPRDYLTEFVAFLAKTPGRDKLCRTIQYAAKFLKWIEETKLADAKKPSVHALKCSHMPRILDDNPFGLSRFSCSIPCLIRPM